MYILNRYLASLVTLFMVSLTAPGHTSLSSNMKNRMDEWLDPTLQAAKPQVVEVLDSIKVQGTVAIPPRDPQNPNEDYGYSFYPDSRFDFFCMNRIQAQRIASLAVKETRRIPILDLGCGCMGYMSTLAVLAGGKVDAVDFKETVTLANAHIYKATQKVIGYEKADSKNFYRAFPLNPQSKAEPSWTETPHVMAICKDVVHFMIESELKVLAARLFKNLTPQGLLFVQSDTPFSIPEYLASYRSRQGKTLCPGLTVNNIKVGSNQKVLITPPIPFVEERHKIRPGLKVAGQFNEDGTVTENKECFHRVKNFFLLEDLAHVFEQAGFITYMQFYVNMFGDTVPEDKLPEVGSPAKACIMFVKPGKVAE